MVDGASAKLEGGRNTLCTCFLLPPRGGRLLAQGLSEGRKEATCVAGARRQPSLAGGGEGGGAQVARLSAGRPDMRIWELLLLRMESWVPPFTPLLARDGCRCLKSTAK